MKIEMKEIRQKQSNPYPHMENQKKEVTKRAIEINAEIKMTSLWGIYIIMEGHHIYFAYSPAIDQVHVQESIPYAELT